VHAVLLDCAGGDDARFRAVRARFAAPVRPRAGKVALCA
jgi:hypothetical protein